MDEKEQLIELRMSTGMNRREFCEYFEIPYRTVQDWEMGKRNMPPYLLRLMKYKIEIERLREMDRNVNIVTDLDENKIVLINDILFKGKRNVNWDDVKEYLKLYVDEFYEIADTKDIVYIGNDFPNEFAGSNYTYKLKGAAAKAKANAAQGIPEMIEISVGRYYRGNTEEKHNRNAKFGWYRYDSRFALPVYDEKGEVERYNVFHASMIIRHAEDNKMYLYDILDIKKETSNPLES